MARIAVGSIAVALCAGGAWAAEPDAPTLAAADGCVWTGGDSGAVGRFLDQWVAQRLGGPLAKWDVGLSDAVAQIELHTDRGVYRIALTLGAQCAQPPTARLRAGGAARGAPSDADLQALAAGFPASRQSVSRGPLPLRVPFVLVALLCAALVAAVPDRLGTTALVCVLVATLVGLAAWPLLFQPFDTDAPVIRAAVTATNVFGDPFHPFLPFALNRPSTWFSLEPWALRLVPLAWLVGETVLLVLAARRDGGAVAGALAGIWFACEVRRRHGLSDLSDWDVAGAFLVALLLTLQRPWASGWRGALLLVALLGAGVASSWLMIIPAGVLAGCIGIEVLRGRWPILPALLIAAVVGGLGWLALHVFVAGSGLVAEIDATALWEQMYAELPLARDLAMALPLALGLGWLAWRSDRVAPRFAAVCLVVVPVAVVVAHRRSHVAGGYYIGLVTPLLLYAAAVATVRAAAGLQARWGVAGAATPAVRLTAVVGLVLATVVRTAPGETGAPVEYLQGIAQETRGNDLRIYTNRRDLARLLTFERARAGDGALTMENAMWGPADLRPRIVVTNDTCPPAPPADARGYYVAVFRGDPAQRQCLHDLARGCRDLAPPAPVGAVGDWVLLRCPGPAPAS